MESHDINAPVLQILVNSKQVGEISIKNGHGTPNHLWAIEGQRSNYEFRIPSSFFGASDNTIVVKAVSGSWIGVDQITLTRIPFKWELWHRIPVPLNFILFWATSFGVSTAHSCKSLPA